MRDGTYQGGFGSDQGCTPDWHRLVEAVVKTNVRVYGKQQARERVERLSRDWPDEAKEILKCSLDLIG